MNCVASARTSPLPSIVRRLASVTSAETVNLRCRPFSFGFFRSVGIFRSASPLASVVVVPVKTSITGTVLAVELPPRSFRRAGAGGVEEVVRAVEGAVRGPLLLPHRVLHLRLRDRRPEVIARDDLRRQRISDPRRRVGAGLDGDLELRLLILLDREGAAAALGPLLSLAPEHRDLVHARGPRRC